MGQTHRQWTLPKNRVHQIQNHRGWIIGKKRRMEGAQEDKDETLEGDKGAKPKPSKGNIREGIKTLETEVGGKAEKKILHHDPGEGNGLIPPVTEDIETLKE